MNIKMTFATLSLILASSASAQTVFTGPSGSLNIGSPIIMVGRSALGNCPRIDMATLPLTPAFTPVFSPVPMGPALPMLPVNPMIPGAPMMPTPAPVMPGRRAPSMPVIASLSALNAVKLSAPSKEDAPAKNVIAAREKLDKMFDGKTQPVVDREDESGPVRSSRHVSLPENDLEKEIGAY